jgi:hypothetical protein
MDGTKQIEVIKKYGGLGINFKKKKIIGKMMLF